MLELAAQKAGWGKPLPAGMHRGIAVAQSFGSYVAEVAEVSVDRDGRPKVHRIVAAVAHEIEMVERNRAVLKPPSSLDAWEAHHRGLWHMYRFSRADNERARQFFAQAIELDPTYADAFHNLGSAYAEQAKWEDAIVAYRKALAQTIYASPENTYNNLGYAYWALDRRKEAEEAFRSALQLEPKLVPSHFWLGVLLEKEGRKDEARRHFQAARDLDPGSMLGKQAAEVLKTMENGK